MKQLTDLASIIAAITGLITVGWGAYKHFFEGSVLRITLRKEQPYNNQANWILSIANKGRIKTTVNNCFIHEYDYHIALRAFHYNKNTPKAIPKKGPYLPIEIPAGETIEIKFLNSELSNEYDTIKRRLRYLAIYDSQRKTPRLIKIKP